VNATDPPFVQLLLKPPRAAHGSKGSAFFADNQPAGGALVLAACSAVAICGKRMAAAGACKRKGTPVDSISAPEQLAPSLVCVEMNPTEMSWMTNTTAQKNWAG
jgi:hypothetical protein